MATYDLEQQEQLDQLKHFWKQYGNLITWLLVAALGAYAAWTGYLYWQQQRAQGAGGLYEELDRAAAAGQADKVKQALADLKAKYAGTTFAEQGALLAARSASAGKKSDDAIAALQWLVREGKSPDLVAVGRLRLAGLLMDNKQYDEALKTLSADLPAEYAAAVADRKGDILFAQNKKDEAGKAYQDAFKAMPEDLEYRRFIEGKLTALGQAPAAPAAKVAPVNPGQAADMPPGLAPTR
jgi:predicted negative regulator of RcsB-dependent stress response